MTSGAHPVALDPFLEDREASRSLAFQATSTPHKFHFKQHKLISITSLKRYKLHCNLTQM